MKKDVSSVENLAELRVELDALEDDNDRIEYLNNFLKDRENIPLEMLAFVYEILGDLHFNEGNPKGSFYQKAASTLEMVFVLDSSKRKDYHKRKILEEALKNYKRALKVFKKKGYLTGLEEIGDKIIEIRQELKSYGGAVRIISLISVVFIFLSSFLFLSSPPTGFVITPLDVQDTTFIGAGLALLGVIGMFFVLKKWY